MRQKAPRVDWSGPWVAIKALARFHPSTRFALMYSPPMLAVELVELDALLLSVDDVIAPGPPFISGTIE
jgi:hypothetical protein